jgi:hypothetical protein
VLKVNTESKLCNAGKVKQVNASNLREQVLWKIAILFVLVGTISEA